MFISEAEGQCDDVSKSAARTAQAWICLDWESTNRPKYSYTLFTMFDTNQQRNFRFDLTFSSIEFTEIILAMMKQWKKLKTFKMYLFKTVSETPASVGFPCCFNLTGTVVCVCDEVL